MNKVWQLQEAKNKFSSLVNKARTDGPQIVTKHGKGSVVVLSFEDYQKMSRQKLDLVSFLKNSPLFNIDIDLSRDKSTSRDLDL